jgi:hypothetical protein
VDSLNSSFNVRFAAPDPNCSLPKANIFWQVRNPEFWEKGHRTLQKFTRTSLPTISTPWENFTAIRNIKKNLLFFEGGVRSWPFATNHGILLTRLERNFTSTKIQSRRSRGPTELVIQSSFRSARHQLFASEGQHFFESSDSRILRKRSQNASKIYDNVSADNIYPGKKFYADPKLQKNLLFLESWVRSWQFATNQGIPLTLLAWNFMSM